MFASTKVAVPSAVLIVPRKFLASESKTGSPLEFGVHVVQRHFKGFGNQWNFALNQLPITAPWTMKLDPDERLTNELKDSIEQIINQNRADGIVLDQSLWVPGGVS